MKRWRTMLRLILAGSLLLSPFCSMSIAMAETMPSDQHAEISGMDVVHEAMPICCTMHETQDRTVDRVGTIADAGCATVCLPQAVVVTAYADAYDARLVRPPDPQPTLEERTQSRRE